MYKKNIIKLFAVFSVFVLFTNFNSVYFAQEPEPELRAASNPALKVVLNYPKDQFHPSKEFTVTLEVDSLIDSNRVGLEWSYPKTILSAKGGEDDVISVTSGNKTTFTKTFAPKLDLPSSVNSRRVDISVRVVGYSAGDSYISTGKTSLVLNSKMEITPSLESYSREKTKNQIIRIGIIVSIIAVVVVLIIFLVKKFIKYLNTPDIN